jgi:hypothetical protein
VKAHHCCRLLCFIGWNRPLSRSKYGHIKTNRAINNQLFLLGPLDKIMDIETAPVLIILISALYRTLLLRADKNSSWYHKQHRIRNNGGITFGELVQSRYHEFFGIFSARITVTAAAYLDPSWAKHRAYWVCRSYVKSPRF